MKIIGIFSIARLENKEDWMNATVADMFGIIGMGLTSHLVLIPFINIRTNR